MIIYTLYLFKVEKKCQNIVISTNSTQTVCLLFNIASDNISYSRMTTTNRLKGLILFIVLHTFISSVYSQGKTLGLTKKLNGNDENGYVLFSPIGVDTTFLIDKCGQRVHSWATRYTPGLALYLKPNGNLLKAGTYDDTTFNTAGGRGGVIEEYDWNGNLLWKHVLFNDSLCQHHDIHPMPNGNVLVLAWHSIPKASAMNLGRLSVNFDKTDELWGERLIELKPVGTDSAEIVWQWDVYDHIVQDVDSTLPNFGKPEDHPERLNINYALNLKTADWIHANGIDYNEKLDQIVISAHNLSEIWIIDHSTTTSQAKSSQGGNSHKGGDFLYRWGNPAAYNKGGRSDQKLFRQHNARWIPDGFRDSGKIMIFNNGWGRDTAYSTVDIINPPLLGYNYNGLTPYLPSGPSWQYKDSVPTRFYSQIISGAQMLPNGNVLVCSGFPGKFFEVTAQKQVVWEYVNPLNAINRQTDGQVPASNSVFRAEFYPSTFPAFKNKNLSQKGPIELNSKPYTCYPENIKPSVVQLTPAKDAGNVVPNTDLSITFSETILKNTGTLNIFSNGTLQENINVNSNQVTVNGNTMTINPNSDFPVNARIAVRIPVTYVRDSSFNTLNAVTDSAAWHFFTVKSKPEIQSRYPSHLSLNHKAGTVISMTFNEDVFKNSGFITLYENGQMIESINVSSNQVAINGKTVSITPSKLFNQDKLIVVEMDKCFKSQYNVLSSAVVYGDWYFRTAVAPKVTQLTPATTSVNNVLRPGIRLTLDKNFSIDSIKDIRIYENNVLKHTFSLSDANISADTNSVSIGLSNDFLYQSRVAISFPANALKDSSGFYFSGIDSGSWHFITQKKVSVNKVNSVDGFKVYPNPASDFLSIELNSDILDIRMTDMSGREVEIKTIQTTDRVWTLSTTELSTGIYIVRVNGTYTATLTVE